MKETSYKLLKKITVPLMDFDDMPDSAAIPIKRRGESSLPDRQREDSPSFSMKY